MDPDGSSGFPFPLRGSNAFWRAFAGYSFYLALFVVYRFGFVVNTRGILGKYHGDVIVAKERCGCGLAKS